MDLYRELTNMGTFVYELPNWTQEVRDMEWYVYYDDFNAGKIIKWNIFKHYSFDKDVSSE